MTTNYEEAYVTITDHFAAYVAVNADNYDENGAPAPEIRFTGVGKNEVPEASFYRFTMNPVSERHATFRNGQLDQRYSNNGVIIIQVFSLIKNQPRAEELCRKLATVGKLAFRGKSLLGCIWFRNVRINAVDREAAYERKNVVAEYEFEEIG